MNEAIKLKAGDRKLTATNWNFVASRKRAPMRNLSYVTERSWTSISLLVTKVAQHTNSERRSTIDLQWRTIWSMGLRYRINQGTKSKLTYTGHGTRCLAVQKLNSIGEYWETPSRGVEPLPPTAQNLKRVTLAIYRVVDLPLIYDGVICLRHIQPTSARFEIRGLPFSLVRGMNMPSGVERICLRHILVSNSELYYPSKS